jgi:hypothetical protein
MTPEHLQPYLTLNCGNQVLEPNLSAEYITNEIDSIWLPIDLDQHQQMNAEEDQTSDVYHLSF